MKTKKDEEMEKHSKFLKCFLIFVLKFCRAGQKRTSSIPSKSSSGGLVTPPPPVIAPPVVVLPVLLQANLIKDPVAMSPNVPVKEGKATRRKVT